MVVQSPSPSEKAANILHMKQPVDDTELPAFQHMHVPHARWKLPPLHILQCTLPLKVLNHMPHLLLNNQDLLMFHLCLWFGPLHPHALIEMFLRLPNGGLYPPPHNPYGLHWTPLDSSGFQCPICQAKLAGTMPSPVWSSLVHWTASHFSESSHSPVDWESSQSPVESSGVHWIACSTYCY